MRGVGHQRPRGLPTLSTSVAACPFLHHREPLLAVVRRGVRPLPPPPTAGMKGSTVCFRVRLDGHGGNVSTEWIRDTRIRPTHPFREETEHVPASRDVLRAGRSRPGRELSSAPGPQLLLELRCVGRESGRADGARGETSGPGWSAVSLSENPT